MRTPLPAESSPFYCITSFLPRIQIALVTHKQDLDVLVSREVLSLLQPLPCTLEGSRRSDVIDEQNSNGAAIVGASDGLVSLLASLAFTMITVSQICSFITLDFTFIVLDANSTPIVASESSLN